MLWGSVKKVPSKLGAALSGRYLAPHLPAEKLLPCTCVPAPKSLLYSACLGSRLSAVQASHPALLLYMVYNLSMGLSQGPVSPTSLSLKF